MSGSTRKGGGVRGWAALGAVVLVVLAAARDYGPEGFWIPWKALLLCALGSAPGLLFAARRARGADDAARVPLVAAIAGLYALYFGLPVLLSDRVAGYWIEPDARAVSHALDLALLGLGAFLLGARAVRAFGLGGRGLALRLAPGREVPLAIGLAACGGLAALTVAAGLVPPLFSQPARLIAFGLPLGVGLGILLARDGRLSPLARTGLLLGAVPLLVLLELSGGKVGGAVSLGGFFLALLWGSGARVPIWLLGAGALGALVLRGGAMEYRVLQNQAPHLLPEGRLEQVALFAELSLGKASEGGGQETFEAILERISQITLLAHVAHLTPEAVPYWRGATYATLPATFVPRALWPDKPQNRLGQDFGHRYAILDGEDRGTSINFPILVEFFANFGASGMAAGMALLGLLFAAAERVLFGPAAGPVAILLGAVVLRYALNVESDLSLLIGSILQQGAVLAACFFPFVARRARSSDLRLVGARA